MQIPFIYLYSKWNAYPETIDNIFDSTKMSCKQLARVLQMSMQKVHQWLYYRQIRSVVRCTGRQGGIAFYQTSDVTHCLSEQQQEQLRFITMSELAFITGINLDRLRRFLATNKNIPSIMVKPKSGKSIKAYDKEIVLDLFKAKEVI